ncbi:hypothetical protein HPB49_006303 [Dermacentor silvarum]|uniref:Uncharacterized protein n=1 Tax=Dermacentor silvarum TaxID=543639 RepID=A0ACB8DVK1_DERSI|nr:hypothetical protein HPB49_006303 [Dermacentor silvarum]
MRLQSIRTSNTEIHSELEGIRGAMGFMNETFEQFKKDVVELRREVTEVKTQNSQCQYDIKQMQKALVEAKQEIIELKQYSRSQNVEIKGILVVPDENLRRVARLPAVSNLSVVLQGNQAGSWESATWSGVGQSVNLPGESHVSERKASRDLKPRVYLL